MLLSDLITKARGAIKKKRKKKICTSTKGLATSELATILVIDVGANLQPSTSVLQLSSSRRTARYHCAFFGVSFGPFRTALGKLTKHPIRLRLKRDLWRQVCEPFSRIFLISIHTAPEKKASTSNVSLLQQRWILVRMISKLEGRLFAILR